MIIYAKLSCRKLLDVYRILGKIQENLEPERHFYVDLNRQTIQNALEYFHPENLPWETVRDRRINDREAVIIHQIDPVTLPVKVVTRIREEMPKLLSN